MRKAEEPEQDDRREGHLRRPGRDRPGARRRSRPSAEKTPYHENAAPVGKVFFDSPEGSMVCSGTVVKDPAHPGKSNLVWTAGPLRARRARTAAGTATSCSSPRTTTSASPTAELQNAVQDEIAPYGAVVGRVGATSDQWIDQGGRDRRRGCPVRLRGAAREAGAGLRASPWRRRSVRRSTVDFNAPAVAEIDEHDGAWGYPAAPPFDGQKMLQCTDRPGRLSLERDAADDVPHRLHA